MQSFIRLFRVALAIGAITFPASGSSQAGPGISETAYATGLSPQTAAQKPAGSSRTINVEINNVSLPDAVRQLGKLARVSVWFNDEILPQDRKVTYNAANVTVREAFTAVLKGTGVGFRFSDDNKVTLGRELRQDEGEGIVTGKVTNGKTGAPVGGVTVFVDDSKQGITASADGTYRIVLESGEHMIHIRAVGFIRQTKRVTVGADETLTLHVTLDPSANVLNEVIVTGTVVETERKAIPTPITVIHAEEIEKRGITRIDQLLRGEVPGLLALEQGMNVYDIALEATETKMYSRGASSLDGGTNPIKTYVDGVELLDPAYLSTIDPRSIERIEIITGPQAATIYGSGALGGVMQVFTKRGAGGAYPELTASLRYGVLESSATSGRAPSHNHALQLSGTTGPTFSYSANASYSYTGQWAPGLSMHSYGASLGATHMSGPVTINGTASFTRGGNGTVDTRSNLGGTPYVQEMVRAGVWGCGVYAEGGASLCSSNLQGSGRKSERSSQLLSLNVDYRHLPWLQHHVTFGRSQNEFSIVPDAPQFLSPRDTMFSFENSTGSRITTSYNSTASLNNLGPLSSVFTIGANTSAGKNTRFSGTASAKTSASYATSQVSTLFDDDTWGGFGSWRIGLLDRLYLTLGVRAEHNKNYGEKHKIDWTPTNGITYSWEYGDLTVKLLGSYGKATRAPTSSYKLQVMSYYSARDDPPTYVERQANPLLKPEYEVGPQGGIELYYGNLGSFTINHYRQDVTNLITLVRVDSLLRTFIPSNFQSYWPTDQYQNVSKIRKQGVEMTGLFSLSLMTVRGTYSWNDSRILELGPQYTGPLRAGQSFLNVPTHTGNINIGLAYRGTSINWILNYIGSRPVALEALPVDLVWTARYGRLQQYIFRKTGFAPLYFRSGYVKSDIVATHRITPWATATVNIINASNSYADDNYNVLAPALGRQTLFGVSLKYPTRR